MFEPDSVQGVDMLIYGRVCLAARARDCKSPTKKHRRFDSYLSHHFMRQCWNWQTGQLEVLVGYARMGSSPFCRTSDLIAIVSNAIRYQPPPTLIVRSFGVNTMKVLGKWYPGPRNHIMGCWWNWQTRQIQVLVFYNVRVQVPRAPP